MKLDFLAGRKTVIGIIGLVIVAILVQYVEMPADLVTSLNTFFQGLIGFGLVMKAERFIAKKK